MVKYESFSYKKKELNLEFSRFSSVFVDEANTGTTIYRDRNMCVNVRCLNSCEIYLNFVASTYVTLSNGAECQVASCRTVALHLLPINHGMPVT